MLLTRATDNRLKAFFTSGEVRFRELALSGQGIPLAGTGGDLRRGNPAAAWRAVPHGRRLDRRRHRADHPRPRRGAGDAPVARDGADGAVGADGQGGSADGRQGSARRRFRLRHPAGVRAARHRHADARRHGAGVSARGLGPGGDLLHRRGRLVARRVARGDQPVRGAQASRGLLPREQPDRAVDAGARAVGRAGVRRQGRRLRHSRHHDRRHRRRRDRGGGRDGRSSGRGPGSGRR